MDSVEVGQFSVILLFIYRFLLFWVALHKVSQKIFYFFVSLLSFRLIYCYERTLDVYKRQLVRLQLPTLQLVSCLLSWLVYHWPKSA